MSVYEADQYLRTVLADERPDKKISMKLLRIYSISVNKDGEKDDLYSPETRLEPRRENGPLPSIMTELFGFLWIFSRGGWISRERLVQSLPTRDFSGCAIC
jgi:hypothetical protein